MKNAGALVAVDTDQFTLDQYRRISPWLIKPNIHELRHVVEVPGTTITDVVTAARRLADAGVENVLVSLGGNGLVCVSRETGDSPEETVRAMVPKVEVKSTGWALGTARWQDILSALSRERAGWNAVGWRRPAARPAP